MSHSFMERALDLAKEAALAGEVPVGAVLVSSLGEILSEERNRTVELKDATARIEKISQSTDGKLSTSPLDSGT